MMFAAELPGLVGRVRASLRFLLKTMVLVGQDGGESAKPARSHECFPLQQRSSIFTYLYVQEDLDLGVHAKVSSDVSIHV